MWIFIGGVMKMSHGKNLPFFHCFGIFLNSGWRQA
jgi:hypothetical protein